MSFKCSVCLLFTSSGSIDCKYEKVANVNAEKKTKLKNRNFANNDFKLKKADFILPN